MTETPAPAPSNNTATPGADAGVGSQLSSADQQIIARDVQELVAKGRMTKEQADLALKQAAGTATPTDKLAPSTTPTPAPAATPEAVKVAQAEIDRLVSGADKEWTKAYLNGSDPGHKAAVDKMTELHKAAFPEDAAPAEEASTPNSATVLPFEFEPDAAPKHMAEVNAAAHEIISALQIDPSLARGAIQNLDRAVNQRRAIGPDGKMGAPKAMDQLELAKFEALLMQRWGSAYNEKFDAVERAIAQSGKHAGWLKRTILHAGPLAACWACETLSTQGARLAPGRTG